MPDFDDTGVVDFYLENYQEWEGQAQYDAWTRHEGEPFDFTGSSYLEEWTRPLRKITPLMERFEECIGEAWNSIICGWCRWPTLDQADLEFIAEIDQCIFEDGDYFLRQDAEFLDDAEKLRLLAMGRELAVLSASFWERLHELGATPKMVREANHLFLLRECGEEFYEESPCYQSELAEAIMDYHPRVEAARANGGDFYDAMKIEISGPASEYAGVFDIWHALGEKSIKDLKAGLAAFVHRDEGGARRIIDPISAKDSAEARKRGWISYRHYEIERVVAEGAQTDSFADISFLSIRPTERFISTYLSPRTRASTVLVGRRTCARDRASRGASSRTRGSRRTAGRSAGGGSSGDPDEPEPAVSRRRFGWLLYVLGAVAALSIFMAPESGMELECASDALSHALTFLWNLSAVAAQIGGALAFCGIVGRFVSRITSRRDR